MAVATFGTDANNVGIAYPFTLVVQENYNPVYAGFFK
jgi:hypothetical protein